MKFEVMQYRNLNKGRFGGIDLARVLAMFLVCWGHVIFLGEYVGHTTGRNLLVSHTIDLITVGCVDLFALISGFVGIKSKCRISSYFKLWGVVFFYNAVIRILLGQSSSIHAFLPVYGNVYWYFTAYTGLFLIMPLINEGVKILTRNQAIRVFVGIFVLSFFTVLTNRDIMSLHSGYSFVWLSLLYIIGAIMRRFEVVRGQLYSWLLVLIPLFLAFIVHIYCPRVHIVSYTSPFILAAMIGVVEKCVRMPIEGLGLLRGGGVSTSVFAVYLIHVHPCIFHGMLKDWCILSREIFVAGGSTMILIGSFAFAAAIFCGCLAIDLTRVVLLHCLRQFKEVLCV